MATAYPLFHSCLQLAHRYWEELLSPGDTVIDATCGNGHDTEKLASLVLPKGHVYAVDIQEAAILATSKRLGAMEGVTLLHSSHEELPAVSPKLIVYNLGYLPGSDKKVKTAHDSTLASLQQALAIVQVGGAITITCYPGHPEGALEEKALIDFTATLDPRQWLATFHTNLNRTKAPTLLLIQRAKADQGL